MPPPAASPDAGVAPPPKLWGGSGLHPLVESYTVQDDYAIDAKYFFPYDIQASKAHAEMLQSIGVLSAEEFSLVDKKFSELKELFERGEFQVRPEDEDCHTAIEKWMVGQCGDAGKKIHTGRSRNDQSLVMIRLFAKKELGRICGGGVVIVHNEFVLPMEETLLHDEFLLHDFLSLLTKPPSKDPPASTPLLHLIIERLVSLELSHPTQPMPGYTHAQKAMPTTVARWLNSYRQAFETSLALLQPLLSDKIMDQNPLGSAAGFGVNHLVLDRERTTSALGFGKVQDNPMFCGFSRGWFEAMCLTTLSSGVMTVCSRFAVDMLTYTQHEFDFFALPNQFTTGSSIMPQKLNYDLFEVMRAHCKVFKNNAATVQEIVMGLGSGYHRDFQLTKKIFAESIVLCKDTLAVLAEALREENFIVKGGNLDRAMRDRDLWATDEVYKLVAGGATFRDAYLQVKEAMAKDTRAEKGEDGEDPKP